MPKRGTKTASPKLTQLAGHGDRDSMATHAQRHLEWLLVKNYSPRTVENRESYLAFFISWCEQRSMLYPQEITKPILERYQRHLFHLRRPDGRALTFRAQHARLVPLRGFFKWLTRQNVLLYNPASELELPKLEHRLPRHVLTLHEAETVMNLPDVRDVMGLRDRAMLETFYSTGMRRSELMNLAVFDLDTERGTILIRQGKGKKDRMVPVGERAAAWIDKYLYEARPQLVAGLDEGALFLMSTGEAFTANRLTQLVRNYVRAAELGKTGSCHLFRHTAATLMLEGGADIRYIQAMLGHAELSTTQIYTQVSIRKLQEVHRATHPAATLERRERKPDLEDEALDMDAERVKLFSALAAEADDEGAELDVGEQDDKAEHE
jgi:integrase/recombinase XerD